MSSIPTKHSVTEYSRVIHSWFINGNPIQTPTPQTTLDYVFTNLSYTDSITYEVKLVIQFGGSGYHVQIL